MFLQNDAGSQGDGKSLKGAYEEFKGTLKGLSDDLLAFDTQARKVVGDTFGQGEAFANKIRLAIAGAVKNTAQLGYTTEQYATLLSQISTNLQTNVDLTSTQLENFMLFADAASISSEEVGKLVTGFQNIGVGAEGALQEMEGLAKTARSYGLNVAQYMGVIGENLKLMNQYKFQGGVEGLGTMVARAQALRINMTTVTSLADKLLDPEGALDTAASLQVLGGEFAQMGDFFGLMNLAQNDVGGLQEQLFGAAASAASFNEETGNFEYSALELRRLRAVAEATNVPFEELTKGGINLRQNMEKMSQLDLMPDIPEEDKKFLASIGQLEGGVLKFNIDGKLMDLGELSKLDPTERDKKLEELGKLQIKAEEEANKSSLDIAREQRDLLTKLYNEANQTRLAIVAQGALNEGGTFETLKNQLNTLGGTMTATTEATLTSDVLRNITTTAVNGLTTAAGSMSTAVSNLTTQISNWMSGLSGSSFSITDDLLSLPGYGNRVLSGPEGSIAFNDKDTIVAGTNLFDSSEDRNTEQIMGNLPKEFANVLQNNLTNVESPSISFEDLQITHSGSIRLEGDGRFLTLDMLANNPQMLENLTNMIKQRMSSQSMGYNNA